MGVSIHAPTRGATRPYSGLALGDPVSIHAPTRGATPIRITAYRIFCRFNSRAHEGRDGHTDIPLLGLSVSIHAPTRGATWFLMESSRK